MSRSKRKPKLTNHIDKTNMEQSSKGSGSKQPGQSGSEPTAKTGRLSKDDLTYILANAGKLPLAEIAKNLGRRLVSVERVARAYAAPTYKQPDGSGEVPLAQSQSPVRGISQGLRATELWKRVSQEFSQDERKFFEEQYQKLMQQFEGNVLPSEEMQVFDCIKLEILKSRNLIERQKVRLDKHALEQELTELLAVKAFAEMEPEAKKIVYALRKEIGSRDSTDKDKTAEYTMLVQRQESIMKSLKSTRDQRINDVSSGKSTFHGLIKQLMQKDHQAAESRQAELHRMAASKEMQRLAQEHLYANGEVDRPILSCDTILGKYDQGTNHVENSEKGEQGDAMATLVSIDESPDSTVSGFGFDEEVSSGN